LAHSCAEVGGRASNRPPDPTQPTVGGQNASHHHDSSLRTGESGDSSKSATPSASTLRHIESGFNRRDTKKIEEKFIEISSVDGKGERTISNNKRSEITQALKELGSFIEPAPGEDETSAAANLLCQIDKNNDGEIDLEEFIAAVQTPWPLESWARSLPLPELLVDCLPPRTRDPPLRQMDHLSDEEIKEVVEGFGLGLTRLLKIHNHELQSRNSFAATNKGINAPLKFQMNVPEGNQGDVQDFHNGLDARIGDEFHVQPYSI